MKILAIVFLLFTSYLTALSQVPLNTAVEILRTEDARHYSPALQNLLYHAEPAVRSRAALAAGRIGHDAAVGPLARLLGSDGSADVRTMAAFALGEIESVKGADAILTALSNAATPDGVRARAVEAAGKIAAANAKDPTAAQLGRAILTALENSRESETILLAITAVLRARPEGADKVVAGFLASPDARVRADAANTLSRIRAKNANGALLTMLRTDRDPIARANAARALGAAEAKEAFDQLLAAATEDRDSRVRVSAIRSLAQLKDARAAGKLLDRGEVLLAQYKRDKKPNLIPSVQSEFVEVATALGRVSANTYDQRAASLFREFGKLDKGHTPEVYIARLRVAPGRGDGTASTELTHWRQYSTMAQIVGEFAVIEPTTDEAKKMKAEAPDIIRPLANAFAVADPRTEADTIKAAPDVLQAFARYKTSDLAEVLRAALENKDVHIRATAAGLIADLPPTPENTAAVKSAFLKSLTTDKHENDAQLALLDALFKLDKPAAASVLNNAIAAQDYLVRRKVLDLLKDKEAWKEVPPSVLQPVLASASTEKSTVRPYVPRTGTRLGQILNTTADYRRALTRKNGAVKAVLTTQKGTFTIDLLPEDAPLTVDNFVKLARSRYFDGLEVHRVVPNFVMQDGDPRGDGNGGPGWSIRCEINMVPYDRGAVGMALSGKDTGGSQWFVTHSPQPHLDGGYTVFGRVNEKDMPVVDNIVRGDKIISVRIVGR